MCAAAAEAAAAVWAVLFPDRLLKILAVLEVDVHEMAALIVLYCLVLGMLQQLPPPPKLREKQQQQQQQQPAALQQQQQQPSQQQPYAGYRADLVALLSNMLYGRRSIQDELLASGGVEVLLNNCNLDDTAPLAREWALWSVRNMCRDNEVVQQYIAQFTAVEAVQSAELERMGKELQLDRATNKLSLVDKPKQQPQQ
ncbi:hypothetical protein OEZ85_007945 [Tetradesmus obliquus]|uniref:Ataxin-10 domain-containing protein n=1 Tax=Tetradesmus obliquus TaxID=3088 RepID=A0ABY8TJP4_TETOB|nr:hypothetical protein OEZ85_007945 [Tetradesmus obliquus]